MQRIQKLTATAALGGLALLGCSDSEGSADSPDDDVVVKACKAGGAGDKPVAEGTILNGTTKSSGYTFRVRFLDTSGNEVAQATNAVAKVEPGATATWTALADRSANGPFKCEVENVTRTAVP